MTMRSILLPVFLFVAAANCADSKGTKRDSGSTGGRGGGSGGSVSSGGATGGDAGEHGATGGSTSGASGTSGGGDTSTGGSAGSSDGGEGASGAAGAAAASGGSTTGGVGGIIGVPGCTPGTRGGTPDVCGFEISCALSATIPTVGVVEWSTDLDGLRDARIEFTLNDPRASEINRGSGGSIDVTGTSHRALMLGLKPQRSYTYRIVATAGDTVCTSPDGTLTTGAAVGAPILTQTNEDGASRANGFIVTSTAFGSSDRKAYIIDADGHPVWWAEAPQDCSRALMDWEGETMWMVETNSSGAAGGEVRRIGMDGMGAENDIEGLVTAHHDFAVVPGGIVAFLVGTGTASGVSNLVERSPDGTLRAVATLDGTVFKSRTGTYWHANSIQYHPTDDSYTVGDRDAWAYVKLTRQGELVWQLGPECDGAPAPKCANAGPHGNHGHQLLDSGNFLSFSTSNPSVVYEHNITETASSLTANLIWSYSAPDRFSTVLGDVQRLPNGNTLVVYSTTGFMHEVSETSELVRVIRVHSAVSGANGSFGYVNFRETLYGSPIR